MISTAILSVATFKSFFFFFTLNNENPHIKSWLEKKGIDKRLFKRKENVELTKLLDKLELDFVAKINSSVCTGKVKNNYGTFNDVFNDFNRDKVRIDNLRLIINLEDGISVVENEHTPTGVRYVVGRAYWFNEAGVKVRIFAKNIGAINKLYDSEGKLPAIERKRLVDEMRIMMIKKFNDTYPDSIIQRIS